MVDITGGKYTVRTVLRYILCGILIGGGGILPGVSAVSYTHLDVYKRQKFCRSVAVICGIRHFFWCTRGAGGILCPYAGDVLRRHQKERGVVFLKVTGGSKRQAFELVKGRKGRKPTVKSSLGPGAFYLHI